MQAIIWKSAEFAAAKFPAETLRGSPIEVVRQCLDWQFRSATFDYAVLVDAPWLGSRTVARWPRIIADASEAQRGVSSLAERGARGFELVVGGTNTGEAIRDFLIASGYQYVGECPYGSKAAYDLSVAPLSDTFTPALNVAMRLGACTLCVFAHDADPIYLLSQ